ncbi:hypothetical protein KY332_01755 [Candidatus Woesearchaeota archaeon]|nr:hypothetical protein [Candidatus Woesearchaeota archaeon]
MIELFSPLHRLKRILKKADKLVRYIEVKLKQGSVESVKKYNRAVERKLGRFKNIFYTKIHHYEQEPANKSILPQITANVEAIEEGLERIKKEIVESEAELKTLSKEDPKFIKSWVDTFTEDYSNLLTNIDLIETALSSLKEPVEKGEEPTVATINEAQKFLNQRKIVTRPTELKALARACGYILEKNDHTIVRAASGRKITEIPEHPQIERETARNIIKSMALGRMIS